MYVSMYVCTHACVDKYIHRRTQASSSRDCLGGWDATEHNGKDRHLSTACLSGLLKFYNRITYIKKKTPKLYFKKSQNGSTLEFVQFFLQIALTHTRVAMSNCGRVRSKADFLCEMVAWGTHACRSLEQEADTKVIYKQLCTFEGEVNHLSQKNGPNCAVIRKAETTAHPAGQTSRSFEIPSSLSIFSILASNQLCYMEKRYQERKEQILHVYQSCQRSHLSRGPVLPRVSLVWDRREKHHWSNSVYPGRTDCPCSKDSKIEAFLNYCVWFCPLWGESRPQNSSCSLYKMGLLPLLPPPPETILTTRRSNTCTITS